MIRTVYVCLPVCLTLFQQCRFSIRRQARICLMAFGVVSSFKCTVLKRKALTSPSVFSLPTCALRACTAPRICFPRPSTTHHFTLPIAAGGGDAEMHEKNNNNDGTRAWIGEALWKAPFWVT
jgi:hypothetical protein